MPMERVLKRGMRTRTEAAVVLFGDDPDPDIPFVQPGILLMESDLARVLRAASHQVQSLAVLARRDVDLAGEIAQAGRPVAADSGDKILQPGLNRLASCCRHESPVIAVGSSC